MWRLITGLNKEINIEQKRLLIARPYTEHLVSHSEAQRPLRRGGKRAGTGGGVGGIINAMDMTWSFTALVKHKLGPLDIPS